jgi:hypothetical protein
MMRKELGSGRSPQELERYLAGFPNWGKPTIGLGYYRPNDWYGSEMAAYEAKLERQPIYKVDYYGLHVLINAVTGESMGGGAWDQPIQASPERVNPEPTPAEKKERAAAARKLGDSGIAVTTPLGALARAAAVGVAVVGGVALLLFARKLLTG